MVGDGFSLQLPSAFNDGYCSLSLFSILGCSARGNGSSYKLPPKFQGALGARCHPFSPLRESPSLCAAANPSALLPGCWGPGWDTEELKQREISERDIKTSQFCGSLALSYGARAVWGMLYWTGPNSLSCLVSVCRRDGGSI